MSNKHCPLCGAEFLTWTGGADFHPSVLRHLRRFWWKCIGRAPRYWKQRIALALR
jgi:hypothetical protein